MATVIDARGFQLVPDISPLAQGVGGLISQRIAERMAQDAAGGDEQALSKLAVRDPKAAYAIGGILQDQRVQQEEEQKRQQEMAYRVARGFRAATNKQAFLSAASKQLRDNGLADMADEIDADVATFAENPAAVEEEYNGIWSMFAPTEERTAGEREFESRTTAAGLKPGTPEYERAARVDLGLDPRAQGSAAMTIANTGQTGAVAGSQAKIKGAEAAAQEASKLGVQGQMLPGVQAGVTEAVEGEKTKAEIDRANEQDVQERQRNYVQAGIAAAEQLPNYDRMIGLLDEVSTGNAAGFLQSARNFFGAADADYQELDSSMKEAILANIRALGANPTEGERKFLLDTAGDIRQSRGALKRILSKYRDRARTAKTRGERLARERGDTDALDLMRGVDKKAASKVDITTPQSQADYDALPSGAIYIDPDDGKQYRKP